MKALILAGVLLLLGVAFGGENDDIIPPRALPLHSKLAEHHPQPMRKNSQLGATNPGPHHHFIPPAAMPGIMKGFDFASSKGNKKLLTELRYLKNKYLPMGQNRIRRSALHRRSVPHVSDTLMEPSRDLRRLRRDLGYDTTPDLSDYRTSAYLDGDKSVYGHHQRNQMKPHQKTPSNSEIDRIIQGLDFLQQLSYMENQRMPQQAVAPGGHHRPFHVPASRFAPQPKIFVDDELVEEMERENEAPIKIPKEYMWVPEKRWSKSKSRASLSMIPGFKKRSVFREAANQQQMIQRFKRQKSVSNLASFLGAEEDPYAATDGLRRTAM